MQGEKSSLDSFPETIDLNQGSIPNDSSVVHSSSWDNLLNPVENRSSNYMVASSVSNVSSTNAVSSRAQSFSGWDRGESSSSANNPQDRTYDHSKMKLGWSSSFGPCSETDARTDSWSFEPSDFSNSSYVGNQVTGISSNMQNYSSNLGSQDVTSNHGPVWESDGHGNLGANLPHNLYKSGQSEAVKTSNLYASSSVAAASGSSSTFFGINNASGPSTGTWGSSCKRKTVEGNSGQFCHGGSSSSNQPVENIKQNPIPGYSGPGSLSISSEPLNLSLTSRSEQLNSRGVGMSRATPASFSSSVPGIPESSGRNPVGRSNTRHHDLVRFDAPRGTPVRRPTAYTTQLLPRPFSSSESLESRSPIVPPINPGNTLNQSHIIPVSEDFGTHPYPWNRSFSTRGGSSSRSFVPSGERGSAVHDEVSARSSLRNNPDFPMLVSVPEARNVPQEQIDWSFAPGTSTSSRNHSFTSRIGPGSSGARASPAVLLPHQIQRSQAHQRFSEFFPWNPTPRIESDSGVRRSPFVPFPSASFSADEAPSSSLGQHQSDQRPAAFLIDTNDDANGWHALAALEGRYALAAVEGRHALAAVEGRHRLQIRQVLSAMRRGVHLQPEDYMLIDPFINGFVEMHDRHRDMRLDVDNMSYEELLALEERIGNVSTGLSEEKILASMKRRKHRVMGVALNLEPCCICQEEYVDGDDVGISDCGHEFHVNCIKQWLILKNLCPICKTTALEV